MSDKLEIKTLKMETPMAKDQIEEGELIIKVSMSDKMPEKVKNSEAYKSLEQEGAEVTAGYMVIDMSMKVGDLTDEDIIGCSPEEYMSNGVIAGILDAIRYGLSDDRGINFRYAVEEAKYKAESADSCISARRLSENMEKLALAITEPEGAA